MKTSQAILLIAAIALLSGVSNATATQIYSFPYNDSSTLTPPDLTTNAYYRPVYDLGILEVGYSLTVTVAIPGISTSTALNGLIPGSSSNGLVLYYDDI